MSAEDFRRVYDLYDINHDGVITSSELKAVLICFGYHVSDQEVNDAVSDLDTNHNGVIDFPEFLTLMETHPPRARGMETLEDMVTAFRALDKDGNGVISGEEIKASMESMGVTMTDEEVQAALNEADTNKDGVINYEEFARMMVRH